MQRIAGDRMNGSEPCWDCGGDGEVLQATSDDPEDDRVVLCPTCEGTGYVACPACDVGGHDEGTEEAYAARGGR